MSRLTALTRSRDPAEMRIEHNQIRGNVIEQVNCLSYLPFSAHGSTRKITKQTLLLTLIIKWIDDEIGD